MKISVIIPVYNNVQYIRACITSVIKQEQNVEIILINDNSTDDLENELNLMKQENIINDKNFVYIKNETNIGPAESRNKGILRATGDYIAFLDADDLWYNYKLMKQIRLIRQKDAVFVYTSRRNVFVDDNSRTKDLQVAEKITYEELLKGNQITCSSVLLKADIAKKYLMKNDEIHEDYYMWLRVLKDYKVAYGVNEPLVEYRIHSNSKSNNKIKSAIMTFKTIRMMDEPFFKCCKCFLSYMIAGLKKYK